VSRDAEKDVPDLTLLEFSKKYKLSDEIRNLLEADGYDTAGALLYASETTLKEAGLKRGHIAGVKRALNQFLAVKSEMK
jgi:hypothetical protein